MLRDPRKELTREPHIAGRKSIFSPSSNVAEPTKPIPVEIRQPDLEPLELFGALSDLCFSHWQSVGW